MKNAASLKIPSNLIHILSDEGFWEDESFDPILVSIEEIHHKGKDKICYEASFGFMEDYEDMDGYRWEDTIRNYIKATNPLIEPKILGEPEEDTCVMWTDDVDNFRIMLDAMIQVTNNKELVDQYKPALEEGKEE